MRRTFSKLFLFFSLFILLSFLSSCGDSTSQKIKYHSVQRASSGKWGFIDEKGNEVIPCKYTLTDPFSSNGLAMVRDDNYLYGYINDKGEEVIPLSYTQAKPFADNGLAAVLRDSNGKWGFIDSEGNIIIKPQFTAVSSFSNGLCAVMGDDNKWGYIDKKGEVVIPFTYDSAMDFNAGKIAAVLDISTYKFGCINASGDVVIPFKYDYIASVSYDDYVIGWQQDYKPNGRWDCLNSSGEVVFSYDDFDYISIHLFGKNGLARVQKDETHYGYINKKGKEVIPCVYTYAYPFEESDYALTMNNSYSLSYINSKGEIAIPVEGYLAGSFKENGLAPVQQTGENSPVAYINQKGEVITEYIYSEWLYDPRWGEDYVD